MKKIVCLIVIISFLNSLCFAETIYFKNGKQLEAKIIERTDKWIKVDIVGVGLTYYLDEIDRINDEKISPPVQGTKPVFPPETPSPAELQPTRSLAASLYKEAGSKLLNVPDNSVELNRILETTLKSGWQDDSKVISLLKDNKDAIDTFKKATMQLSDGYTFGKRPEKLNVATDIHRFIDEVKLLRLLLTEARMYEANKQYAQAEDDYLSATRFLLHMSQEKFKTILNGIVIYICLLIALPCLTDSVKSNAFSKEYYSNLLDNLVSIRNNQDFWKDAFEIEIEAQKGTARMFEGAKNAKNLKEALDMFKISEPGQKKDPLEIFAQILPADFLFDSDFFAEFYQEFDKGIDEHMRNVILAIQKNSPESYQALEDKLSTIDDTIKQFQNPLYRQKKRLAENKTEKQLFADWMAIIIISLVIPRSWKISTRVHNFYNHINTLIAGVAIRLYQLDNRRLPDDLSQLVPKYLESVPQDTYNNFQPLKYKKRDSGFVVYSIGPNRQDDKANTDILDLPKASQATAGDIIFSY